MTDTAQAGLLNKHWFNEFNPGRRSLKDECREDPPKTAVVPENIAAERELIMQVRHVTYREIEAPLGISSTNKHSILHEHMAAKIFVFAGSRII